MVALGLGLFGFCRALAIKRTADRPTKPILEQIKLLLSLAVTY